MPTSSTTARVASCPRSSASFPPRASKEALHRQRPDVERVLDAVVGAQQGGLPERQLDRRGRSQDLFGARAVLRVALGIPRHPFPVAAGVNPLHSAPEEQVEAEVLLEAEPVRLVNGASALAERPVPVGLLVPLPVP